MLYVWFTFVGCGVDEQTPKGLRGVYIALHLRARKDVKKPSNGLLSSLYLIGVVLLGGVCFRMIQALEWSSKDVLRVL